MSKFLSFSSISKILPCKKVQYVTPTKGTSVVVQSGNFRLESRERLRIITDEGTPAKMRQSESNEITGMMTGKRKPNWSDSMKIQLFEAWCKSTDTPFLFQARSVKKAEREDIFKQMMKKFFFIMEDGGEKPLGELTSNTDDFLWRKLMMNREGLSIDKKAQKPLLSYLDDKVAEKYPNVNK